MMKLGCMSLSLRNLDAHAFIDTVADLGLDVIEFHTSAFPATDPDTLRAIKMHCLRRGLPVGYLGISNDFGKPEAQHPEQIALIKKWIDVAAFMSIPLVRVFAAYVPKDCPDEAALWPPMVRAMKEVAAYGHEKGVVVGLQNHNHGNVTRTGDDVLRLLREVDHPYFAHIMDTGQYAGSPGASGHGDKEYDCYRSMEQTVPYAVYVRTKFYRVDSGVEEWLDYPRIFKLLRGINYNGCLSIVYEGQSEPRPSIEKAAAYLRKLTRDH
jgi:sugar phosphate isomerase/epimerase